MRRLGCECIRMGVQTADERTMRHYLSLVNPRILLGSREPNCFRYLEVIVGVLYGAVRSVKPSLLAESRVWLHSWSTLVVNA